MVRTVADKAPSSFSHCSSSAICAPGTSANILAFRSDKALRTPAFGALIDVMHEARLVRFGAGKAHFRAAFYAPRFFVETLGLVLCHCPPHGWLLAPCTLGIHGAAP